MEPNKLPAHIVFYDGDCGLCNYGVQFILKHDRSKKIHFSALQDDLGQRTMKLLNLPTTDLSTFIYSRNDKYFTKSTAALYSLKDCKSWISALFIFIVIPKFFRDFVYTTITKNRKKIVSQEKACWMPTSELKKRFL